MGTVGFGDHAAVQDSRSHVERDEVVICVDCVSNNSLSNSTINVIVKVSQVS